MTSTADLSVIDTLKIGKLNNSGQNVYFTLPVSITDANANLQSLSIDVSTDITLTDNNGQTVANFYDLNHTTTNAAVSKTFRLIPTKPGDYTVTATVADKFNMQASLSKQLYVFDNMKPKCVVSEAYYYIDAILYQIHVDIRSSFDQDEKWGGSISEYKAIFHYTWQDDPAPMMPDLAGTPGIFETADAGWEQIGWVEAWVIDNEGAESEHIRIDLTLKP